VHCLERLPRVGVGGAEVRVGGAKLGVDCDGGAEGFDRLVEPAE